MGYFSGLKGIPTMSDTEETQPQVSDFERLKHIDEQGDEHLKALYSDQPSLQA
jgi:hypothetical protein